MVVCFTFTWISSCWCLLLWKPCPLCCCTLWYWKPNKKLYPSCCCTRLSQEPDTNLWTPLVLSQQWIIYAQHKNGWQEWYLASWCKQDCCWALRFAVQGHAQPWQCCACYQRETFGLGRAVEPNKKMGRKHLSSHARRRDDRNQSTHRAGTLTIPPMAHVQFARKSVA